MTIPGSTVTIDFKDVGDGKTEIALHHVGFPSDESCGNHRAILDALSAQLS